MPGSVIGWFGSRGEAGPVATWSGSLVRIVGSPTAATATLTVGSDGTLSGSNYSGQSDWYSPSGGTPGNSYWVKFTATGDANTSGVTLGTTYALSSNRSITWSVTGGVLTATLTVTIYSDSGATQTVGVGTVNVNCDST